MIGKTIEIDLAEYGDKSGAKLVLAPMSGRNRNRMLNEIGRHCKIPLKKGETPTMDKIDIGDSRIITMMAYVKMAPFEPTLEGFLAYMDMLDEIEMGKGCEFQDRVEKEVERIISGDLSPLSDSPEAVTQNSA